MNFVAVERRQPVLRQPVETALLADLVREALGSEAALVGHALLGEGHFNTSYRIDLADGARAVLRLGPAAGAHLWRHEQQMLARECSVQPLLRTLGEVIPRLLHADTSRRLVARDWALFEHRDGEVWETAMPRLTPADQQALWHEFGALVARLHALPGDRFGFPAPAPALASVSAWFIALVEGLAADLAEQRIAVAGLDGLLALLRQPDARARLDAGLPAGQPPRLAHGDLWPRNVLISHGPAGLAPERVAGCRARLLRRPLGRVDLRLPGPASRLLGQLRPKAGRCRSDRSGGVAPARLPGPRCPADDARGLPLRLRCRLRAAAIRAALPRAGRRTGHRTRPPRIPSEGRCRLPGQRLTRPEGRSP
ncbi:MAG: phosphotransferase [Ideonella sp.]|nr:phosphotransferase [Ideonella sp.]